MDNLTIFVALTAVAILIQAGILVALYVAMRQTSARLEALASEFRSKALPTLETAQIMLTELRPQVNQIVGNLNQSTTLVKSQMARLEATVNDVIDRTRLQVIRADEMVSKTMDRVEETTDLVHNTVVSPIRQLTGLMHGLSVGLEFLVGQKRRTRDGMGVPQDEMFI
jgi:hypothetical protein